MEVFTTQVESGRQGQNGEPSIGPVYRNLISKDQFPSLDEDIGTTWDMFKISAEKFSGNKMLGHREFIDGKMREILMAENRQKYQKVKKLSGQASELSLKGSPYWMAPEIINAASQDSNSDFAFAVDIWSLVCTIIEIVNGKPPWSEFEGATAMFKVWKESPPIPETISPCGKDFLQCCFRRNPAERPSASMLLEHPFIKNSVSPDIHAFTQSFSAMKLGDPTLSPRECTSYRVGLCTSLLGVKVAANGNLLDFYKGSI